MTRQRREFDCYCLDRENPLSEEFVVSFNNGTIIKKVLYKIGLRAKIKHIDSFVLYTESESDLEDFIFIPTDTYYEYRKLFFTDVFSIEDLNKLIYKIKTINIFEYTSLLEFTNIYKDFKDFIEVNWNILDMDELIEI